MNESSPSQRASWVDSANDPANDFPIQNLPYGIFTISGGGAPRVGVAIGRHVLDVSEAARAGLIPPSPALEACARATLNPLMQLDRRDQTALRSALAELLDRDSDTGLRAAKLRERILRPMSDASMHLPVTVGDYTDFYASIHHATNVGSMFRPDNPLLPNYKYVPIGYHGRASSIVVSGTPVTRPSGQTLAPDADAPSFGPSRMLDYESELGLFVGQGNVLGEVIALSDAEDRVFGYCLVNDWSARDIQSWEYQPLGPFLAKNFATTISPWVVTADSVGPYRIPAATRPKGDPAPLPYLNTKENQLRGGLDATLEVFLSSARMRAERISPMLVSRAPFSLMYWTMAQMLTHHASNGCNLRAGDLIASGTVSGPSTKEMGCLLELTKRGANPLQLPSGESRKFLEDGDEVVMKGYFQSAASPRIGFGECSGMILPAIGG